MKFGLKDDVVGRIREVFALFPEVNEVILYGSRAKGNFKPYSDIDLTIIGDNLSHTILNKIREKLDDLLLPVTFDISIYSQIISKDLLDHIERVGIPFYTKSIIVKS
jgi:predicted nucleotidyltransferase